jgi:drug/metabolite transporter (DMT)-like permease
MNYLLILHCFLFVITLSEYLICMKYINNAYNYKNEWFNMLLSIFFTPFYCFLFINDINRKKLKLYFLPENRNKLLFPIGSGILYTIETILLFYALNTITLSYYTVLRSGFILFNIPWFKFLLYKKITNIYLVSCVFLIGSHTLIISNYLSNNPDDPNILRNTIIIVLSCFINSSYNNIIEYSIKKYRIPNIDFQIIFQITYFALIIIGSIYYTMQNLPPIDGQTIFIYFLIAFGLQMYMFNKIYILNNRNDYIPANLLLSSLDLLRRIIQLIFSFLFFNEPFDSSVILSLVCLGISSLLLLYEYLKDNFMKKIEHIELLEIIESKN